MTSPTRRRAFLAAAAMGGAGLLAAAVKPPRRDASAPPSIVLEALFPHDLAGWRTDPVGRAFVRPTDRQGRPYGVYDQVLERTFVGRDGQRVMLSVAFGEEQSSGLQLHRPEICYRSSGYEVRDKQVTTIDVRGHALAATRLVAALPGRIEPITYWTVLGGVAVPDHTGFRWRRIVHALHGELLDGMLVRVSSIDPDPAHAFGTHAEFVAALAATLEPSARVRVFGAGAAA